MSGDTCRSCGAAIVWALSDSFKRMPFDATPDPKGRWKLVDGYAKNAGPSTREDRYTSHFATCPNADQHRRRSRG